MQETHCPSCPALLGKLLPILVHGLDVGTSTPRIFVFLCGKKTRSKCVTETFWKVFVFSGSKVAKSRSETERHETNLLFDLKLWQSFVTTRTRTRLHV